MLCNGVSLVSTGQRYIAESAELTCQLTVLNIPLVQGNVIVTLCLSTDTPKTRILKSIFSEQRAQLRPWFSRVQVPCSVQFKHALGDFAQLGPGTPATLKSFQKVPFPSACRAAKERK